MENTENSEAADGLLPLSMQSSVQERPLVCIRDDFDELNNDPKTRPMLLLPKQFNDNRGCFSVSLSKDHDVMGKDTAEVVWLKDLLQEAHQLNRSISWPGVFRGFHAQQGKDAQGKLVECFSETPIWDVIIDARPDASSFKQYTVFKLSGSGMEKVWVPKGFLHGFLVPRSDIVKTADIKKDVTDKDEKYTKLTFTAPAHVQYIVDQRYAPESEISVTPAIMLKIMEETYKAEIKQDPETNYTVFGFVETLDGGVVVSEKDKNGKDLQEFLVEIENDWKTSGSLWYM